MLRKSKLILSMSIILSLLMPSLIGCDFQDDYILETKENTDDKPSGDKVDEIFDSEKMTELMDKLKTTPGDISDKIDEVDSDTERMMRELSDKADELTDKLNNADLEGKSEDIKTQMEDINDKLDEIKDKVDDTKDRADNYESPIDSTKVTDTLDDFQSKMDNLENALNRTQK